MNRKKRPARKVAHAQPSNTVQKRYAELCKSIPELGKKCVRHANALWEEMWEMAEQVHELKSVCHSLGKPYEVDAIRLCKGETAFHYLRDLYTAFEGSRQKALKCGKAPYTLLRAFRKERAKKNRENKARTKAKGKAVAIAAPVVPKPILGKLYSHKITGELFRAVECDEGGIVQAQPLDIDNNPQGDVITVQFSELDGPVTVETGYRGGDEETHHDADDAKPTLKAALAAIKELAANGPWEILTAIIGFLGLRWADVAAWAQREGKAAEAWATDKSEAVARAEQGDAADAPWPPPITCGPIPPWKKAKVGQYVTWGAHRVMVIGDIADSEIILDDPFHPRGKYHIRAKPDQWDHVEETTAERVKSEFARLRLPEPAMKEQANAQQLPTEPTGLEHKQPDEAEPVEQLPTDQPAPLPPKIVNHGDYYRVGNDILRVMSKRNKTGDCVHGDFATGRDGRGIKKTDLGEKVTDADWLKLQDETIEARNATEPETETYAKHITELRRAGCRDLADFVEKQAEAGKIERVAAAAENPEPQFTSLGGRPRRKLINGQDDPTDYDPGEVSSEEEYARHDARPEVLETIPCPKGQTAADRKRGWELGSYVSQKSSATGLLVVGRIIAFGDIATHTPGRGELQVEFPDGAKVCWPKSFCSSATEKDFVAFAKRQKRPTKAKPTKRKG